MSQKSKGAAASRMRPEDIAEMIEDGISKVYKARKTLEVKDMMTEGNTARKRAAER